MPWSEKQNKLFRAAEHNPAIAKSAGIPQATAAKLAHEGVIKHDAKTKLSAALRGKYSGSASGTSGIGGGTAGAAGS